jgi:hypothetical protein
MIHACDTGTQLESHQTRPRLDQDERQDTSEVRVGRRSEGPAPSVEKLERARLDRTARAEDEGPEGSGHSTTVLERLAVSRGREDVRHRPARPVDKRQRGVRVSASRKRAGVLRGERDHSDVDLLHSVGTGDAKVRPELGAGDERLENNTKLGVRGEGVVNKPLDLFVATERNRSATRAGLVVTERRGLAAVDTEVEWTRTERAKVKTRGNVSVGQLEDRSKGHDTEPATTEDSGRLREGVASQFGQTSEDTLESSGEGLVASHPLSDDRPLVVHIEQQDRSEGDICRVRAGLVCERRTLCMREHTQTAQSSRQRDDVGVRCESSRRRSKEKSRVE